MTKICNICNESRDLNDFPSDRTKKDGKQYRCKKCHNEYQRSYNKRRPLRIREQNPKIVLNKICTICQIEKPETKFYLIKDNKRFASCKECECKKYDKNKHEIQTKRRFKNRENKEARRDIWLQWKYGITLDHYKKMSENQNHNCAICGINRSELKKDLYIDHCHTTGKVRKLLCQYCNMGLGSFFEDEILMNKAIEYIKLFKG